MINCIDLTYLSLSLAQSFIVLLELDLGCHPIAYIFECPEPLVHTQVPDISLSKN